MIDINSPDELEPEIPAEINLEDFLGEIPEEMIENDDGSVEIALEDALVAPQAFTDNLAEHLPIEFLQKTAQDLLELVEHDIKAREKRDKQYEEGIRRTGLGDDAPGGAGFSGASRVVHPVLAESCVDFAARAIKELFPAGGPVRMETDGLGTPEEEKLVQQTAKMLNDQYTRRIPEYRRVTEQELTQLPLGGSQFVKQFYDATKKRICAEFVPIDDIFVPFFADGFYEAPRQTHRQFLSQDAIEERIASGQYRDIKVVKSILEPDRSASSVATDKVEGKDSSGFNEDGVRPVYEIYVNLKIEDDQFSMGESAPYIVTIDPMETDIFSVYRNWDEMDPVRTKEEWITEDMFIPWRGAYGIGLPHLIGSLSAAATGSLRALLDSAHINNAPTLLKLKGSKMSGQTKSVDVTQIVDIEGPVGTDDIRKYLMTMPFNPPSQVLFSLLGWLTDAAKGVVSTASEKIADATSNTPVGTTQALIEQGSIIFSSIHSRLHFSQAKKFEITLRLIKKYMPEVLQEYGLTPEMVSIKGIHPVSDPNIFSEAQRMAQLQSMMKLAEMSPQMYNQPELHKQALSLLKVKNFERFLVPPPPQPQPMDPAQEMLAFLSGAPIAVVPQQDHLNHIAVHLNYLKDPMMGMNPIMVQVTAKLLDHLREHLVHFFAARLAHSVQMQQQQVQQQTQQLQMQGQQIQQLVMAGQADPAILQQLPQPPQMPPVEAVMAQASDQVVSEDTQLAQQALELITQAEKFVKDHIQSQDPNLMVGMADVQRKRDNDQASMDLAREREKNLRELEAAKQLESRSNTQHEQRLDQERLDHDRRFDMLSQKIELMNNDADNRQKQITELLKNHDDNKTAIIVEQVRQTVQAETQRFLADKDYMRSVETETAPVQKSDTKVDD